MLQLIVFPDPGPNPDGTLGVAIYLVILLFWLKYSMTTWIFVDAANTLNLAAHRVSSLGINSYAMYGEMMELIFNNFYDPCPFCRVTLYYSV